MRFTRHRPPELDERGVPRHGATVGETGKVVRAVSRGAGVEVPVPHPYQGAPRRVLSGAGSVRFNGGDLFVTPTSASEGETVTLVVEF